MLPAQASVDRLIRTADSLQHRQILPDLMGERLFLRRGRLGPALQQVPQMDPVLLLGQAVAESAKRPVLLASWSICSCRIRRNSRIDSESWRLTASDRSTVSEAVSDSARYICRAMAKAVSNSSCLMSPPPRRRRSEPPRPFPPDGSWPAARTPCPSPAPARPCCGRSAPG